MSTPVIREYEMGYTPAEFDRVLHGQFITTSSDYQCHKLSASQWEVSYNGGETVTISIEAQPPRELGMFSLPVLGVQFQFSGRDEAARETFQKRFFKYFHKGGG